LPVVSNGFFPPVLIMEAWTPLYDLCRDIYHRLAARTRSLAAQIASRDVSFGSEAAGGAEAMLKLKVANGFVVVLRQLINTPRLHPYNLYLELCRMAGELAVFDGTREAPDLPVYDHDQLGICFFELSDQLERLLDSIVPTAYVRKPFEMLQNQLQCSLDEEWLSRDMDLYLGIESDYDEEQVLGKVRGIKLAATGDVARIDQRRLPGLRLQAVRRVPAGLPDRGGSHYFRIKREGELWEGVQRDQNLAVSGSVDPAMELCIYVLLAQ
jgi:type VI secretion system protein ImpJ